MKSKKGLHGHTGALLVAMPRRQCESFVVAVKLSVVERQARRRLKDLTKVHLTQLFKIKVMCQVKVR